MNDGVPGVRRCLGRGMAALAGALLALIGCEVLSSPPPQATPVPVSPVVTLFPTLPASPVPPAPTAALNQAWRQIAPGLEYQQARITYADIEDWLTLVRVDPAEAAFQVRYAPGAPLTVREWQAATGAAAAINAGFFTADFKATGLIILDGKAFGQTYRGFGGMFAVRAGIPTLQWLVAQPYRPDRRITQAIQSFPMLVHAGRAVDGIPEDGSRNRRSFAGVDARGRVVLGVTTLPFWRLTDVANYLAGQSGLELREALNLDGGGSAGLWVAGAPDAELVNSVDPVPAVLMVVFP